jgi:hypothetical protein
LPPSFSVVLFLNDSVFPGSHGGGAPTRIRICQRGVFP